MKQVTDGQQDSTESKIEIDIVKALRVLEYLTEDPDHATATEIASATGTRITEVLAILGHPEFVRRFTKLRRDAAKTEFNAIAHNTLRDIALRTAITAPAIAIKATKVWAGILGEEHSKRGAGVSVAVSFEQIIKQAEQKGISLDDKTTLYPGLD